MDDPIAENQTELTISKLTNRTEGDIVLNQAVAAILLSLTKFCTELASVKTELSNVKSELETVKSNLWKPNDLENLIDKRHIMACKECPTRRMVEMWELERQHLAKEKAEKAAEAIKNSEPKEKTFWGHLFSKDGLLIIVVILFALLCIRSMVGQQGYQDITSTLQMNKAVQK